jgi:YggT family protein
MQDALIFLIDTFSRLYLYILLLRFWLPLLRANYRNPIAQGVMRYTSPAVVPFRRFIPPIGAIDTATVVVSMLIQLAAMIVVGTIRQGSGFIQALPDQALALIAAAFFNLVNLSVVLFIVAIVVRIVLSFFGRNYGPLSEILFNLTEPLLRPVRRILPPMGVVDLSAYIVIILLIALTMVLADIQYRLL